MKSNYQKSIILIGLLLTSFSSKADIHRINSAAELSEVCLTIQQGDIVVLADGTYTDQHFTFMGEGTSEHPITLRAETSGKTILNGSSRLSIAGEYLIVDGLLFLGGALESGSIIEFRGNYSLPTQHSVLRNTAIKDYNPPDIDTRYFWVSLYGYGNMVENCSFSGQSHSGVTVCVRLQDGKPAGHTIRRNYFSNRPDGKGNGFETIRIGIGKHRMTNAQCVVSQNLFEACNGELEIISNKSCENTYAENTFLNCSGTLTLRQGNRCKIENNVFIGGDNKGAGGIRITGEAHHITGNYFSGTKGRAGGAISLRAGTPGNNRGYPQVKNCIIDSNTFVDNPGTLFALDSGFNQDSANLLPEDVTISNTLMLVPADAESIIAAKNQPTGIVWKKNIVVGNDFDRSLPHGVKVYPEVPNVRKVRLNPKHLNREDVGASWMN